MRESRSGLRRVLGILLRLYPSGFRDSVGADLVTTLEARWQDARKASVWSVLRFWVFEVARFAWDGVLERARGLNGGEVRQALRQMGRAPMFHGLAILVVASGIGSTAAILTVTDAVVFRSLPYERSEDLYLLRSRFGEMQFSSNSLPNLRDLPALAGSMEWIAGVHDWSPALTGAGEPVRVFAVDVTDRYLPGLGARASIGRLFESSDAEARSARVVVISWGLWQRVWGGDPSVVGRTIDLDNITHTIVGVMDRRWRDPQPIESGTVTTVWLPVREDAPGQSDRSDYEYQLIGRARPGVALAVLGEELKAAGNTLSDSYPDNMINNSKLELLAVPLKEATVGEARSRLLLMLGSVALLLLLACANVANLFLARGSTRRSELSVRGALGASRARIARQLFTESLITAVLGGMVGVGIGMAGLRVFKALAPAEMPRLYEAHIDLRALLLVVLAILTTGVLSGIVPALRSSADSGAALRDTRATANAKRQRLQSGLVAIEIALALVLVTGSALLLRSFTALLHVDPGFDGTDLVVADIRPPGNVAPGVRQAFFATVLERAQSIPAVRQASLMYTAPIAGGGMWTRVSADDADAANDQAAPFIRITSVLGDAIGTMGMRMRSGVPFAEQVASSDPGVVILNGTAAREIFPGVNDPTGRRLRFGTVQDGAPLRTVIGVVGDVSQNGPGQEPEAQIYAPATQSRANRYSLVLRMAAGAPPPAAAIRTIVDEAGSGVPVDRIATMEELMAGSLAEARFLTSLLTAFALLALLLAVVGTYGTASHAVTRRLREMSIRMALGARARSVLGLLLGRAAVTAAIGVAAGALAGVFLSRFLESYLFGVGARDPLAFVGAAVVISGSAVLASLLPALRAARVDPNRVLRIEG